MKIFTHRFPILLLISCISTSCALGATYEIGPGKPLRTLNEVPWESLQPGDHVLIHWRPEPYREKWVISRQGTPHERIRIEGVPGPGGRLPVIDGENAVTVKKPPYWGEARSVVKIGGSMDSNNRPPAWITISNLEIRGGMPPYAFTGQKGPGQYSGPTAGFWIENGDHITLQGCTIHDCANGLFSSSKSSNILVQNCHIYDNGLLHSIGVHNIYTESNRIIFEYNRLGPLREGCSGNNLKDRSAGLVVRYNWIEGGNRQLDLVDADDSPALRAEPAYRKTFVYGNILIEPANDGNNQMVHYGGDMGKPDTYRKGTLYFYNNTVISRRTDRTTLFRLATNDEHVDCRNNILYVTSAPTTLVMLDSAGQIELTSNWIKPGWGNSSGRLTGSVKATGTINGTEPGFVNETANDFHLTDKSPCRKAGTPLPAEIPDDYRLLNEYVQPQSGKPRSDAGTENGPQDLGAFAK